MGASSSIHILNILYICWHQYAGIHAGNPRLGLVFAGHTNYDRHVPLGHSYNTVNANRKGFHLYKLNLTSFKELSDWLVSYNIQVSGGQVNNLVSAAHQRM